MGFVGPEGPPAAGGSSKGQTQGEIQEILAGEFLLAIPRLAGGPYPLVAENTFPCVCVCVCVGGGFGVQPP